MQILRWLFKVTREQSKEATSNPSSKNDYEAKGNCIIIIEKRDIFKKLKIARGTELRFRHVEPIALLFRKDIAKTCFYGSLNLRRIRSFNRSTNWVHTMKMKKEYISTGLGINEKADSICPVGNKVLLLSNATFTSSKNTHDQCGSSDKKNKLKGDKTKTTSRMKELVRWAAAAKSLKASKFMGRKVLHNRVAVKAATSDDDQLAKESPKISFRWDVESCFTVTSAYPTVSMPSTLRNDQLGHTIFLNSTNEQAGDRVACRKGNWITTDSEFVVLEL